MRPYLLLDVDGVISPGFSSGSYRKRYKLGWRKTRIYIPDRDYEYPVYYDPAMGQRITDLAERTGAELAWASSWNDNANKYIAPLIGLPELPVFQARADFKAYDVVPAIPDGRPFTWLDDDFKVATSRFITPPSHVVWVDPRVGLTDVNLRHAEFWLRLQAGEIREEGIPERMD